MRTPPKIRRVFIASPGDLGGERELFRKTLTKLNAGFGRGADVEFQALCWEDHPSCAGRRSQSVINRMIDQCARRRVERIAPHLFRYVLTE